MQLSDLLVDAWVALPLGADDLPGALRELLERVAAGGVLASERVQRLAEGLAEGEQGELVRLSDHVVGVLASVEGLDGLAVTVGVSVTPLAVQAGDWTGEARALILVLTPGRLAEARQEVIPALTRVLKDPGRTERLLRARSVGEVRGFRELMEAEFRPRLRVEDAVVAVKYRVYPDTPLDEVVDLIVRRGVHAVPVVGDRYEVLGILTSGDALAYLLRRGGRGAGRDGRTGVGPPLAARDFMTRTVLCVSEDQALTEAAHMMVSRDVEQLPVVREGQLVGFVTRDSILRALRGSPEPEQNDQPSLERGS